jgi:hypothetical protein
MGINIRDLLYILAEKSVGFMCELPYTIVRLDELNRDEPVKESIEDYKYLYSSSGSYFISYLVDDDIPAFYNMSDEYLNYSKIVKYTVKSICGIIDNRWTYVYDTGILQDHAITHLYIIEHYFDPDMLRICIKYNKGLILIDFYANDLDIPILNHPKYAEIADELPRGYNPIMHRIMRGGTVFKAILGLEYSAFCNNLREYIKEDAL